MNFSKSNKSQKRNKKHRNMFRTVKIELITILILIVCVSIVAKNNSSDESSKKDETSKKEDIATMESNIPDWYTPQVSPAGNIATGIATNSSGSVLSADELNKLAEDQKQAKIEAEREEKERQLEQEREAQVAEEKMQAEEEAQKEALRNQLASQGTSGGVDYSSIVSLDQAMADEQFQTVVAIVRQEGGDTYDGAYAVISTAYNRCRANKWKSHGSTIYAQLTSNGQYSWGISKYHSLCEKYLDINIVEQPVIQACYDVMYGGKAPMHQYCSFRSASKIARNGEKICGNTYFDAQ